MGGLLTAPATSAPRSADRSLAEVFVMIQDFAFVPQSVTVHVGDRVRWFNNDDAVHTTTSDSGLWHSGPMERGASFPHVFTTPGTFTYHCAIHPSMRGTVIVQ